MITGEDFYSWNPLYFKVKDPETGRYFGDVIGNVSLEDQLKVVSDAGVDQIEKIEAAGNEQILTIQSLSGKFTSLWTIIERVEQSLTGAAAQVRNDGHEFIEDFVANYVPPSEDFIDPFDETSEPVRVPNNIEFYSWVPNFFLVRDPTDGRYFGNAIGNVPLHEQLQVVIDSGNECKELILDTGADATAELREGSEKYRVITKNYSNVMREITKFFDGVFVLDESALDRTPLG